MELTHPAIKQALQTLASVCDGAFTQDGVGFNGSDPVTATWLQWSEMDLKIDAILEQKQDRIDLVLEGKRKTLRGIKSPADIAKELAEHFFGAKRLGR